MSKISIIILLVCCVAVLIGLHAFAKKKGPQDELCFWLIFNIALISFLLCAALKVIMNH